MRKRIANDESFATGFDRLVKLGPHEIQVGILKRLRGTPIVRHDSEWQMVYSPHPPYEILSNRLLDFSDIQELRRFASYWDTIANSGNFHETLPLVWNDASTGNSVEIRGDNAGSPFVQFRLLANWIFDRERKMHGIPLPRMLELLFQYLTDVKQYPAERVADKLWHDYQHGGRSDKPRCLRPFIDSVAPGSKADSKQKPLGPKRQSRHKHQDSVSNDNSD